MGTCFAVDRPESPSLQPQLNVLKSENEKLKSAIEVIENVSNEDNSEQKLIEELKKIDINNYTKTSFENFFVIARVLDVYDGDTFTIAFFPPESNKYIIDSIRMYGYDSPEMKSREKDETLKKLEKEAAIRVKSIVSDLILDKIVYVKFTKKEKFGRQMGYIYLDKEMKFCLNEFIVNKGLSKVYKGEKKDSWEIQELQNIINFKL